MRQRGWLNVALTSKMVGKCRSQVEVTPSVTLTSVELTSHVKSFCQTNVEFTMRHTEHESLVTYLPSNWLPGTEKPNCGGCGPETSPVERVTRTKMWGTPPSMSQRSGAARCSCRRPGQRRVSWKPLPRPREDPGEDAGARSLRRRMSLGPKIQRDPSKCP